MTLSSSSQHAVRVSSCWMESHLNGGARVVTGSRMTWKYMDVLQGYFILWFFRRHHASVALLQTETLRACPCYCRLQHSALPAKDALNAASSPRHSGETLERLLERQSGWLVDTSFRQVFDHILVILALMRLFQTNNTFSTSFLLRNGRWTRLNYSLVRWRHTSCVCWNPGCADTYITYHIDHPAYPRFGLCQGLGSGWWGRELLSELVFAGNIHFKICISMRFHKFEWKSMR